MPVLNPYRWPLNLRKCPICQTIFKPVKAQTYCNTQCYLDAHKKERNEYMKNLMARRRATKKEKKLGIEPNWG